MQEVALTGDVPEIKQVWNKAKERTDDWKAGNPRWTVFCIGLDNGDHEPFSAEKFGQLAGLIGHAAERWRQGANQPNVHRLICHYPCFTRREYGSQ